jgi:hypothetical protein
VNSHTPTWQVLELYRSKQALLQEWEAAPAREQAENYEYIQELTRKVRKLRNYLAHRKDSPI